VLTSTSIASSMTASRRTPAICATVGVATVPGSASAGGGPLTPTAMIRSAPRLIAGLSGAVLRMEPSP
jgi:hypothetical protein